MKKFQLREHKTFSCFITTVVFFGLYSLLLVQIFTPGVMVNDDVAMMSFANGDFTGTPESQLVFIGAFFGILLEALYETFEVVAWYPFSLVALQIFSSALVVTFLYRFSFFKVTKELIATFAVLFVTTPVLVLDISFSTTAMYASISGIVCATVFIQGQSQFPRWSIVFPGAVLVSASSLRFDFYLSALLLLAPLFLLLRPKQTPRSGVYLLGIILLVPLGTHYVEMAISDTEEWSNYREFNRLRGSMHGTPGLSRIVSSSYEDSTIAKIREFGWESEDLLLFGNWYFEEPSLYNQASLRQLKQLIDAERATLPLQVSIENVFLGREVLILLGVCFIFLGTNITKRLTRNLILVQVLWFIGISVFISSRLRFPDRFAIGAISGLFIALLMICFIMASPEDQPSTGDKSDVVRSDAILLVIVALMGVFVIPHKFSASEISKRNDNEAIRLTSEIQSINEITTVGRFIFIGAQIGAEGINPWSQRTLLDGDRFLGMGWATGSPHQETRKINMSLNGSFLTQLASEPNSYIVTNQAVADLLRTSFQRRQGLDLKMEPIKNLTYGTVYEVSIENKEDENLYD